MTEKTISHYQPPEHFAAGADILREGDVGDCAYIIESGRAEMLVGQNGQQARVSEAGPGSIIGEMALIGDEPRAMTVRAVEDCTVLRISRDDFSRRLDQADPVLRMVMRVILRRYRDLLGRGQGGPAPAPHFASLPEAADPPAHVAAINAIKAGLELREAMAHRQLCLFYQPIIDVQNMRLSGFEALMRWIHPEKGMISPGVFIPVAEETGLIVDMSRFALDVACDDVKKLEGALRPDIAPDHPLFVSVNMSVKDFAQGDFFVEVIKTLNRNDTPSANIHLEITESRLMDEPEAARAALEKCRAKGLHVSIDDFGSGYSSLSYLHAFPIDTLKIDQSFIRSMRANASSLVLVKSIIGLARNLNMKIIAEGIETREEARVVRDLGCHECQGYWFAKPLPLDQAIAFARDWQPPSLWEEAQG
jgi:EAL domain-containing protein (putative c-di-GMP-specific phosphodiesterase class I)